MRFVTFGDGTKMVVFMFFLHGFAPPPPNFFSHLESSPGFRLHKIPKTQKMAVVNLTTPSFGGKTTLPKTSRENLKARENDLFIPQKESFIDSNHPFSRINLLLVSVKTISFFWGGDLSPPPKKLVFFGRVKS